MSDNEAKQSKIKNEIPICGDGWLAVFDLIAPRQLGLEIALLSRRFDHYVDEHFKSRRWTLALMGIESKIGENGAKEIQIFNNSWKSLSIPKVPLPKKVVGFQSIYIKYIDQSVVDFLHHFRHLFVLCETNLCIRSFDDIRAFGLILQLIWPLIKDNIRALSLDTPRTLSLIQIFVPSFLNDSPSLRTISAAYDVFSAFSFDGNAYTTDERLVAKWLFSPCRRLLDGAPKVLKCEFRSNAQWTSKIEGLKTAFVNASSPANFIIFICNNCCVKHSDMSFELINQITEERMTLKQSFNCFFMIVRCPIREERNWDNWEQEMMMERQHDFQWNKIFI